MRITATMPRMMRVRQHFPDPTVTDIPKAVADQIAVINLSDRIKPGDTVALTGGSRGIANIDTVLKAAVDAMKALGAKPFIIPAMGSHGGATAEGQIDVLLHYGITEETMGCEIRSSMDAGLIGTTTNGTPVYRDKNAESADHIGVINRVKPHTDFHGVIESGLCKMMAIGLGKQLGASRYHKAFLRYDFEETVLDAARINIGTGKVAFGLAVVENAYDDTAIVRAIPADNIIEVEQELIIEARKLMGRLPVMDLDCLIVDYMGKNISGTGMDTNIIGRAMFPDLYPLPAGVPSIMRIFVRDMTEESYGNASGIGFADVTTTRLVNGIDRHATMMNAYTANTPHGMKKPIDFETDKEALEWLLNTLGLTPPEHSRTIQIHSTLHLKEVLVSEALVDEVKGRDDIELLGGLEPMKFNADGNLVNV
ncbi:MAG: lactate racemase domain-containing protein [Candidatus Poribacteria bacterium]|nr:lactate racemase domain-containing protein [Candidatus Poribacteria bacterium]